MISCVYFFAHDTALMTFFTYMTYLSIVIIIFFFLSGIPCGLCNNCYYLCHDDVDDDDDDERVRVLCVRRRLQLHYIRIKFPLA